MAQNGSQEVSKIAQGASTTAQVTSKMLQKEPQEAKIIEKQLVFQLFFATRPDAAIVASEGRSPAPWGTEDGTRWHQEGPR